MKALHPGNNFHRFNADRGDPLAQLNCALLVVFEAAGIDFSCMISTIVTTPTVGRSDFDLLCNV
jgi:hypothetical protein